MNRVDETRSFASVCCKTGLYIQLYVILITIIIGKPIVCLIIRNVCFQTVLISLSPEVTIEISVSSRIFFGCLSIFGSTGVIENPMFELFRSTHLM